ncbi:unnamed protein product [Owenia fusiformis]|uniref:Transcription elongation factor A N-terminal and central domain-containing protein 2 n=1 Tax=Owenia fusiformis TaxID=6347 RepID=A0A8J1XUR3_OWEFU|nr:unnamed protein product [Owenia fusiformis]
MDKYIIKTKRTSCSGSTEKVSEKQFVQATIHSLQGVVIVEDLWRLKSVLRLEGQSDENLLQALTELDKKIPPRDLLQKTKIGHTLKKVSKHSNNEVSRQATALINKWKAHFESKLDRPQIEVKQDKKTEKLRKSGRNLIADALGSTEKKQLCESIEREVFHQCKRLVNNAYRRTMRKVIFTLKHKEEIRTKVMSLEMDIKDLVKTSLKT